MLITTDRKDENCWGVGGYLFTLLLDLLIVFSSSSFALIKAYAMLTLSHTGRRMNCIYIIVYFNIEGFE